MTLPTSDHKINDSFSDQELLSTIDTQLHFHYLGSEQCIIVDLLEESLQVEDSITMILQKALVGKILVILIVV